jgi:hypothetical protein
LADQHHPASLKSGRKIQTTFVFTDSEIVRIPVSTGYLPGAHDKDCPIYPIVAASIQPDAQSMTPRAEAIEAGHPADRLPDDGAHTPIIARLRPMHFLRGTGTGFLRGQRVTASIQASRYSRGVPYPISSFFDRFSFNRITDAGLMRSILICCK